MAFTFKIAFVIIQCIQSCFSVSHTWRYVFTESKERNSFPELIFSEMVDEQELYYYDSNNKSLIRRYEWLKTLENRAFLDLHFITIDDIQTAYKLNINFVKEFFNHTYAGSHTSQVIVGCDVDFEDQTETFFAQTAYDGQDFFDADFDKQTCTMLVDQAESLKKKCNLKERLSPQWTPFWRELCTQWLKDFIIYGNDTLQRKVAPKVSLIQRVSHNPSEVEVVCHVTGFFPRVVEVIWMKNNQEEMEAKSGPILPNEDDTYQVRKTIRINNDDIEKYTYSCHVDHTSLTKKLIVLWTYRSETKNAIAVIIGVIITMILIAALITGFCIWKRKNIGEPRRIQLGGFRPWSRYMNLFGHFATDNTSISESHNAEENEQCVQRLNDTI